MPEKNYNNNDFEHILEDDIDIWQCINCGAYAEKKEDIDHFPSCSPGEAKRWEEFYSKIEEEEE